MSFVLEFCNMSDFEKDLHAACGCLQPNVIYVSLFNKVIEDYLDREFLDEEDMSGMFVFNQYSRIYYEVVGFEFNITHIKCENEKNDKFKINYIDMVNGEFINDNLLNN